MERLGFTDTESKELLRIAKFLLSSIGDSLRPGDVRMLKETIRRAVGESTPPRDVFGLNAVLLSFQTAEIEVQEIGMKRDCVMAILLYSVVQDGLLSEEEIKRSFGEGVAHIIHGLVRVHRLYDKNPVIESENFRNLLLSFAEDMRVILIMIADRVNLMRQIRDTDNVAARNRAAEEANYLYAPLAHKLGLYKMKSELEDLSLKYLEHDAYYMIREKLNATKRSRDAYIDDFIGPIKERLEEMGIPCHVKGRTKSIHSIWQKMKKQKCAFEGIYDLFAIRIIIDSPPEKEKMLCWQTYSLVTDMYQPNPKRLRDWLSVPKTNGYESLHITVLGPQEKWVEVQIRTERMDEVAERGLAAHWRYKGIKGETGLDDWLNNIRSALETNDDAHLMNQFKMELYEDEVFVFTPKGDLLKFPKGATLLDFAYHIHSGIGNRCVGGRINNKNVSIKYVLCSGDQVEVLTQSNQTPKPDWLKIVKTGRAKAKLRLALKETQVRDGVFGKEMLVRKLKNRKIEMDEGSMSHLIKKMGFKETSDFYKHIADGKLDTNSVIEKYIEVRNYDLNLNAPVVTRSAGEYSYEESPAVKGLTQEDELVIGGDLKGVDYTLAKCCHPIYGDDIFGFVTVNGGIKVHQANCPNAPELRRRFGYRIVKARWSGKGTSKYGITLRVVGNDDIGIVNNITSIISKEEKIVMRSINIDSHDGLFSGTLSIMIDDTSKLETLLKKLRTVKGVKNVVRL